jgi:hypothetical protein
MAWPTWSRADGSARTRHAQVGVVHRRCRNGGTLSVVDLDWKVEGSPLRFNIRGKFPHRRHLTNLQAVAGP